MKKSELSIEDIHSVDLYAKRGIQLVKGKDVFVWDNQGNKYIDCTSGQGVAIIGHANSRVARAIARQAKRLITCTGSFYNDQRAQLIEKLVKITPKGLDKVFLCNSGTESVEAAIKFARYSSKKSEFICATRGFHGRTMGALSATHNPKYREDFQPLVPGFTYVDFNDIEQLNAAVTSDTAAVLIELVQGEGGVYAADQTYVYQVQELCREKGILLIIDEVQTGFGRTGSLFACDQYKVQPDILCLAKGLGGGFPIGAVITKSTITLGVGKHGTTFGGNPLAAAAANAAIDFILKADLAAKADEMGAYFMRQFADQSLPVVKDVRQIGLMIAIDLTREAKPFIKALQNKQILALPAGNNIIRLLPPLTIKKKHLDFVIDGLVDVLSTGQGKITG